jgi:hypothetical protein
MPHPKVIEIERIVAAYLTHNRHDPSTGESSFDERPPARP